MSETELKPPGENKQITKAERDCILLTKESPYSIVLLVRSGGQGGHYLLRLTTDHQNFISILDLRTKD